MKKETFVVLAYKYIWKKNRSNISEILNISWVLGSRTLMSADLAKYNDPKHFS